MEQRAYGLGSMGDRVVESWSYDLPLTEDDGSVSIIARNEYYRVSDPVSITIKCDPSGAPLFVSAPRLLPL